LNREELPQNTNTQPQSKARPARCEVLTTDDYRGIDPTNCTDILRKHFERKTLLKPSPKQVAMGTTMSSVGLANKPPALPPVKQNNKTVSAWLAFKILFTLSAKLHITFLLQFHYCNVMACQASIPRNP